MCSRMNASVSTLSGVMHFFIRILPLQYLWEEIEKKREWDMRTTMMVKQVLLNLSPPSSRSNFTCSWWWWSKWSSCFFFLPTSSLIQKTSDSNLNIFCGCCATRSFTDRKREETPRLGDNERSDPWRCFETDRNTNESIWEHETRQTLTSSNILEPFPFSTFFFSSRHVNWQAKNLLDCNLLRILLTLSCQDSWLRSFFFAFLSLLFSSLNLLWDFFVDSKV